VTGQVATATVDINAAPSRVWTALTDPAEIKTYMFGSDVVTDWTPGGPIVWKGEYEGRRYEDKGEVVEVKPGHRLIVTHFSPLSGQPDEPGNYHTVSYELTESPAGTHVELTQDNNRSAEEAEHSAANWQTMLDGLKMHIESE
jgi:uncharacterized protein YndB with AHSA1/START domain